MKLVIINNNQYGYHIDTYYYSECLSKKIDVTYICYDQSKDKVISDNVNVIYVSNKGWWGKRFYRLFFTYFSFAKSNRIDFLFVKYFKGCCLFSIASKANAMVDFRTVSVSPKKYKRVIEDFGIKIESLFFRFKSVISNSVADKLKVDFDIVLPLAAERLGSANVVDFTNGFRFVYVGTFTGRRLDIFLDGIIKFIENGGKVTNIALIGDGDDESSMLIKDKISSHLVVADLVDMPGFIKHCDLNRYFSNSNVGIAYVPMNSYYDNQPVTKTYEYLASGLPVIATETKGNKSAVNCKNGILVKDDSDSVSEGLFRLMNSDISTKSVMRNSMIITWDEVSDRLYNFIREFSK